MLPSGFQIIKGRGWAVLAPGRIIGVGHPTAGSEPANEVQAVSENVTWLRSQLARRRLLSRTWRNPLQETRLQSGAPATAGGYGQGYLRYETLVEVAEGRDSVGSDLSVLVDHLGGYITVEVADEAGTTFGGGYTHTAGGSRTTATGTISAPASVVGARVLRVTVYMAADGGANHRLYGVRVGELEIPFADL